MWNSSDFKLKVYYWSQCNASVPFTNTTGCREGIAHHHDKSWTRGNWAVKLPVLQFKKNTWTAMHQWQHAIYLHIPTSLRLMTFWKKWWVMRSTSKSSDNWVASHVKCTSGMAASEARIRILSMLVRGSRSSHSPRDTSEWHSSPGHLQVTQKTPISLNEKK